MLCQGGAQRSSRRGPDRGKNECGYPPGPVLIELARVLKVSTDQLLDVKTPRKGRAAQEDPEVRRLWKKFQQIMTLPEKDRRAVIRLVNSLVAAKTVQRG